MIADVLMDTVLDSVKMLPFLLAAFFLMEWLERYSGEYMNRLLVKVGHAGPLVGALLGCVPQCGFSVVAANLYAGGIITPGTILAVFLATSDEAVLILLGNPGRGKEILWLLAVKVMIGTVAGYLIDAWIPGRHSYEEDMERICADCGCHGHMHEHGNGQVFYAALHHTVRVFVYIFIFTGILNFAIELVGIEKLSAVLMGDSLLQPLLAALVGMIPNCASSVMLTQLYLSGAIRFASAVAGLCTGAGLGLAVLFRMNEDKKESLKITGLLYAAGAISGVVLSFLR
ncbi:putative manganese transporter [Lachnospiraceae bacterium 46-15]